MTTRRRWLACLLVCLLPVAALAEAPKASATPAGRLLYLGVGINAYPGDDKLDCCVKDARDVSKVLQEKGSSVFRSVEVKLLKDKQATRQGILDGVAWLQKEATEQDLTVIFYSGHGGNGPKNGFFLVPSGFDDDHPQKTMLKGKELYDEASKVKGRVLVLLDCCHAGGMLKEQMANGPIVLAAARAKETADEDSKLHNGVFTRAVVEALSGKADSDANGFISVQELERYVKKRVKQLSKNQQHAVNSKSAAATVTPLTKR